MEEYSHIGQLILRIGLGILFFAAGIMKVVFAGVSGITQMLSGSGFPIPGFFAVILIFTEIIAGGALIIGFKPKWASILLGIIMIVAILTVELKTFTQEFPAQMQFFKDVAILVGLISIFFTGSGAYTLKH